MPIRVEAEVEKLLSESLESVEDPIDPELFIKAGAEEIIQQKLEKLRGTERPASGETLIKLIDT